MGSHQCCALYFSAGMRERVCVFLLCHNDDVALASRRTGASVQPPYIHAERAWSQQAAENL